MPHIFPSNQLPSLSKSAPINFLIYSQPPPNSDDQLSVGIHYQFHIFETITGGGLPFQGNIYEMISLPKSGKISKGIFFKSKNNILAVGGEAKVEMDEWMDRQSRNKLTYEWSDIVTSWAAHRNYLQKELFTMRTVFSEELWSDYKIRPTKISKI